MEESNTLLQDIMSLSTPPLADDTNIIDDSMRMLKQQAVSDASELSESHVHIEQSIVGMSDVEKELRDVLKEVEDTFTKLSTDLHHIDIPTLVDTEESLRNLDDVIEGRMTSDINALRQQIVEQEKSVVNYKLDLSELRRRVKFYEDVYVRMPRKCFRGAGRLEIKK